MWLRALFLASRPKTLSASLVPIVGATALVSAQGLETRTWISLFALTAAALIQIGTNFVNDALDFIKGADGENRLGEARATQQGWLSARAVLAIGLSCFGAAVLLGFPLVWEGGWPILVIGLVSVLMGYAYTGGPWPLAYVGLGDLFVIIFFGLVAVGGVYYLQSKTYSAEALVMGLQIGFLATVLIAINNLRDLDQDRAANKRTLAVRLGPKRGRLEVLALVSGAFLLNIYWLQIGFIYAFALPLLALPLALRLVLTVLRTPAGRHYNQLLAKAAFLHMLFGVLLSAGLILG